MFTLKVFCFPWEVFWSPACSKKGKQAIPDGIQQTYFRQANSRDLSLRKQSDSARGYSNFTSLVASMEDDVELSE